MALHRDIHWIGRQWAVTGFGMQLIDQKLKGFFDIEIERLWEEAHMETMRAKQWLNRADFDKGLDVARKRFPKDGVAAPPTVAPPPVAEKIATAPVLPVAPAIEPKPEVQAIAPVAAPSVVAPPIAPIETPPEIEKPAEKPAKPMRLRIDPVQPPPASKSPAIKTPIPKAAGSGAEASGAAASRPTFQMLFPVEAKFVRPWRVRVRK